jgi:ribosomal protein S18 acetylase RimI-like enzyme
MMATVDFSGRVMALNLTGALRLYESVGFRPVKRTTIYRKPLHESER